MCVPIEINILVLASKIMSNIFLLWGKHVTWCCVGDSLSEAEPVSIYCRPYFHANFMPCCGQTVELMQSGCIWDSHTQSNISVCKYLKSSSKTFITYTTIFSCNFSNSMSRVMALLLKYISQ
jgi:hypothetical protein